MESVHDHDINLYHNVPVVMLGFSKSVMCDFSKTINVFEKSVMMLKDVAKHDNFESVHLILWSDIAKYMGLIKVSDIDATNIYQSKPIPHGGSDLYEGFKTILKDVRNNIHTIDNAYIPTYIFTDGNIYDPKYGLSFLIKKMNKFKYDLRMIVIENNDTEYLINDQISNNNLVQIAKHDESLNLIKFILLFNRLYDTYEQKFIIHYTVMMTKDYVQYNDKCFHIKNYALFLAYISSKINKIKSHIAMAETQLDNSGDPNNEIASNSNGLDQIIKTNIGLLEKIGFNLIKTIKDLVQVKNLKKYNKRQLIDFYCNLIGIDKITKFMKDELIYGVDEELFQKCRDEKRKDNAKTQFNMYTNLNKTINSLSSYHYTSFIEHSNDNKSASIYFIEAENIDHSINLGIRNCKHAGIYDSETKRLIPIIPILRNNHYWDLQTIRQWICTIYSKQYGIPISSDLITYTFLIDNVYIQCSNDLPQSIKDTYTTVTEIMLDIKLKQILLSDLSGEDHLILLQRCPNYPMFSGVKETKCLWDCIVKTIIRPTHEIADKKIDMTDMIDMIIKLNPEKIPTLKKILLNSIVVPNYYCFISMSDTDETGGYMIYPHETLRNKKKFTCKPGYVMSQEACDFYKQNNTALKCPLCITAIDVSMMIPIESKEEYEKRADVLLDAQNKDSKRIYKRVEIYDEYSDELINLDELDFSNNYRHQVAFKEHIILGSAMDSYCVFKLDPNNKQQAFNEKVPKFLLEIDMANVVVAGGMCRSILLGQKIQDIDMFFVGLTEDEVKQRLIPLINDVVTTLQKEDSEYRFIMMHKPINSVVEILCTKSTFDESQIDDDLSNQITLSEQYLFSQNVVIHKVQIILKAHRDIKHIFDEFDMYCSCVAFDGVNTIFNEASYIAFKYMVNLIDPIKASHTAYNHRILKYHKYGFSIGLYKKMLTQEVLYQIEKSPKIIKISGCVFKLSDQSDLLNNDDEYNQNDRDQNNKYQSLNNDYLLIDSFKLENKNISSNDEKYQKEPENEPMYESYQEDIQKQDDLSSNMAGLYDYISNNDIRYCYLFGKIDQDSIYEVIDIDNINFLKRNRDDAFNWYSSDQIEIIER
jgi:hypothetical protein